MLAVTGGVPRYLEELRPDLSAEGNLHRLCFHREGLLFKEFDQIFHDLFRRRGPFYKGLLERLVHGGLSASQWAAKMKLSNCALERNSPNIVFQNLSILPSVIG